MCPSREMLSKAGRHIAPLKQTIIKVIKIPNRAVFHALLQAHKSGEKFLQFALVVVDEFVSHTGGNFSPTQRSSRRESAIIELRAENG